MAIKPKKKQPGSNVVPTISAAGSQSQGTNGGPRLAKKRPPRRKSSNSTAPIGGTPAPSGGGSRMPATGAPVAPYDPLAPLTPLQMQQQATQAAMAQIQPQLNTVNQAQSQGQMAHDTRNQQNQGWADWQQGNLNQAFEDTRNALNNLVTAQGGVDQASKDSLAAALRAGTGSTTQAAQALGGIDPTNLAPVLGSSADAAKSAEMSVGSGAGALQALAGANRALPSVGLAQGQDQERQRWNAQLQGFNQQKSDISGSVPGLVQASLKDLQDHEMAKMQFGEQKANDLFQQYLSEKELNLKSKDQTFQQWLSKQELGLKASDQTFQQGLATSQLGETVRSNKANEKLQRQQFLSQRQIDWANVGINRTQAEGTLAQISADAAKEKDAKKKDQLKARGEGIAKAMEALSGYMTQHKGEADPTNARYPYGAATAEVPADTIKGTKDVPATKQYQRLFDDALRVMTQYTTRSDALRILMKSEYSDWRGKASALYNRMKRRPGSGASGYPTKGGSGAGA